MQIPRAETLDAWTWFLRAHRRLIGALDTQLRQQADMTLDEYDVLYQLRRVGRALSMSELADLVLVSRPTTTRVVDRLVRRGWVDRRADEKDRRLVLVALTEAGRRAQARAGRVHLDGIARLVERRLGGHDVATVAAALQALAEPS